MDLSEVKNLPKVDHTPAELDEGSQFLLRLAALIEERGHCKNQCTDDAGRVCFVQAQSIILGMGGEGVAKGYRDGYARMMRAVGTRNLIGWNNHPDTTEEQIISKIRAVALGIA